VDRETAYEIVERLIEDLQDRQDLGDAFEELPWSVQSDIYKRWTDINEENA